MSKERCWAICSIRNILEARVDDLLVQLDQERPAVQRG